MRVNRSLAGVLCAAALALGGSGSAQAAAPEPDFIITPSPALGPDLTDPCGVAASASGGGLFLSNYYNHSIDTLPLDAAPPHLPRQVFTTSFLANVDPLGGPCGLALDGLGRLYINNYHRNVERYSLSGDFFQTPTLIDSGDPGDPGRNPTGVAADLATNNVYVNNRTYIAAYDSSGAPIMDSGNPLRIGQGSLGDGYGIVVSRFLGNVDYPSTAGRIYVSDHSDDTIKVYDPGSAEFPDDPAQVIDGSGLPGGGFASLRDSAIAIDWVAGTIYVADTLAYPQYTERPEATIYVLRPDGSVDPSRYRLKYNVIDPSPPGLAVDNSAAPTQGRVYVTSGNTVGSAVIAYPRDSATNVSAPPPAGASSTLGANPGPIEGPRPAGGGGGTAAAPPPGGAPLASHSVIAQEGTLRVAVDGGLAPKRLPRRGVAPIAVSVGGRITTTDASMPPQLKKLRIELNRNGKLDFEGLPVCHYGGIQPGSSSRALASCRSAKVGGGSFTANITLSGQEPYPTTGRLLVFHGKRGGKPVLYGHIYSAKPFATSFVIVFKVQRLGRGVYGIGLNAPLPPAMDAWGRLTSLEMTLSRRYSHKGRRHSFISAGCPAPRGFPGADFPLVRTSFYFDGGKKLDSTLISNCKAKG